MSKLEKVTFQAEGEEIVEFYVLEQTRIGGTNYLLVSEEAEGDCAAYILKDLSQDGDAEAVYEFVEDDKECEAVAGVFANMLEDCDIE